MSHGCVDTTTDEATLGDAARVAHLKADLVFNAGPAMRPFYETNLVERGLERGNNRAVHQDCSTIAFGWPAMLEIRRFRLITGSLARMTLDIRPCETRALSRPSITAVALWLRFATEDASQKRPPPAPPSTTKLCPTTKRT
jgi:hypothetical protein